MNRRVIALAFLLAFAVVQAASCQPVYVNGPENQRLNLVFIGEGYADAQTQLLAKTMVDSVFGSNGVTPYAGRAGDFNFFVASGLENAVIDCPAGGPCGIGGRGSDKCENSLRAAVLSACPDADVIVLLSKESFNPFTNGVRGDILQLSKPFAEQSTTAVSDYLKARGVSDPAPSPDSFYQMSFAHELAHSFGLYDEFAIEGTSVVTGCPVSTGVGDNGAGYPNCQDGASAANGFWWGGFVGRGFGGNKILTAQEQAVLRSPARTSLPFPVYLSCLLTRECPDYTKFLSSVSSGYCLKSKANYKPSAAALMAPDAMIAYAFEKPEYAESKRAILGAYQASKVNAEISAKLEQKRSLFNATQYVTVPSGWVSGSQTINLKKGYNLVSTPFLQLESMNSSDCLEALYFLKYDRQTGWVETSALRGGEGRLIYARHDCSLTLRGKFYYGSVKLAKGWNLAAFPLAKKYSGDCDFQKIMTLASGTAGVQYTELSGQAASNIVLNIQDAFWVYAKDDCVLTPTVWPWQ